MADFTIKVGDLVPSITATLRDADGAALDINQATVMFVMQKIRANMPTVEAEATNLQSGPGTEGMVRYDWVEGDTDIQGGYDAVWRVEFADGQGTIPSNGYVAVEIERNLGSGS